MAGLPTSFHKRKYLQNLKYNARACIFHLILVGIVSILILTVKNRGVGGLLNGQNLLSVTKKYLSTVPSKTVNSDNTSS